MPVYLDRPHPAPPPQPRRSPAVQTLLLGIGIAYINVAIFMMVFSEPPQMKHFLWAAGLGIGAGLLTCRRNSEPASAPPVQSSAATPS